MVNKSDYNCFDYNIVAKEGSDTTVAILWCTGLESSDYWVKEAGTLFTFKGTLTENAKPGDVIPVKIVPISRDENSKMVFGHIDGEKDVKFSSAAEDGQITVKEKSGAQLKPTLWGDLDVNGAVTAADLVAMVQFILDPDIAHVSDQGIVNGDLFHADGKATDVKSDDVLDANDLFLLKKLILEDLGQEDFPMEKLS